MSAGCRSWAGPASLCLPGVTVTGCAPTSDRGPAHACRGLRRTVLFRCAPALRWLPRASQSRHTRRRGVGNRAGGRWCRSARGCGRVVQQPTATSPRRRLRRDVRAAPKAHRRESGCPPRVAYLDPLRSPGRASGRQRRAHSVIVGRAGPCEPRGRCAARPETRSGSRRPAGSSGGRGPTSPANPPAGGAPARRAATGTRVPPNAPRACKIRKPRPGNPSAKEPGPANDQRDQSVHPRPVCKTGRAGRAPVHPVPGPRTVQSLRSRLRPKSSR
ncbi:hypothetical protein ATK36_5864 [Amycolatopsis sulphurea]|uniref:Uncharacterized protein n=1 Tax=Amycolatopsis sulphurea TaxID=76022 RepID=A0A2A9FJJ5_9PSEU|nr:hypothetical protein ATK36_5864 [Amycolatopsis sulphurea]